MESANLHHHQLHQDHQHLVGSSTLATPCFSVGSNHALTSNLLLDLSQKDHTHVPDSLSSFNLQDLGRHSWLNNSRGNEANGYFISLPENGRHQHLAKIKEELKSENSSSFPKFTDLLNSGNSSCTHENDEERRQMTDLSEKLLLKTFSLSPDYHVDSRVYLSRGAFQCLSTPDNAPFSVGTMPSIHGSTSHIHPTVNISNLSNMSSGFPSSADVNLQALDLFSMERLGAGSGNHPADSNNSGLVDDCSQLGFTHMQQFSRHKQSIDPENFSSFISNNGVLTEPKRTGSAVEPKPSHPASKRQRGEPRASCPPSKVRKEKLGDRIAALQQLVAPFGKTDTASVLMEAIGYIKFLQNQVETLSVPYMKLSSRRKSSNTMQEVSSVGIENEAGNPDLRSRGLCLVPLSCMSYITNDGGGGVWPPQPNFSPGF